MSSKSLITLLMFALAGASLALPNTPVGNGALIELHEENWQQILTGEWMIEFHAPWCPACRALQPEWKKFASWSEDLGIGVGAVDVTENPGLSGRFLVTALPTIYHVKDGVFRLFKGSRDVNTFTDFVDAKKWTSIEPLSTWTAPQSFQMTLVSNLFKISMLLRSIHTQMVDHYGVPYWGSYMLFAVCTIVVGAVLGLFIVYIIDIFWPSAGDSSGAPQRKSQDKPKVQFREVDNVEDDSDKPSEAPAGKDSGSGSENSKKNSPQPTPDALRKRRPRKE